MAPFLYLLLSVTPSFSSHILPLPFSFLFFFYDASILLPALIE